MEKVIIIIFALLTLCFGCFIVYFVFKQLQFVIQAINLYKKMIVRQDVMIKLLQGDSVDADSLVAEEEEADDIFCSSCGAKWPKSYMGRQCNKCLATIS